MALINLTTLFGITVANGAVNTKTVNFRGSEKFGAFGFENLEPYKDGFSTNPIGVATTKAEIEKLAQNPKIKAILKEYNLPLRVNMDALKEMI